MKKNIILTIIALSFASFSIAQNTVQPTLSMRFNDVVGDTNGIVEPVLCLGLEMSLDEGVSAGFDSDGKDSRIFVAFEYGTMGLGINAGGDPQFTVGANYSTLSNLVVSLDYIFNNLARELDDDDVPVDGTTATNELRLSLGVTF
tara:strand:- start:358 stop:792 length:435 start_codon:yes stop_codon:yes gene_type:complete